MKIVLAAINAKYIHSNLAVYSLRAYAMEHLRENEQESPVEIELAEYTINQQVDDILIDLYRKKPDVLCFSCYIWNLTFVEQIVREIHKLLPDMAIWLGGPEVSYDSVDVLERLPGATGVMKGEGEATFTEMCGAYEYGLPLDGIEGITLRLANGEIKENPWREPMNLSDVPFIYEDMEDFAHKIIYYETSRGCPFSCSYCLSSIDKRLRFRDLDLVKKELQFFLDRQVPQVKFVDRTFNCKHDHAMAVWQYILDHDNGITNFHFEISADLINEEELGIMRKMRPGLIQLEIGVQSTNPQTIGEIHRTMKFEDVEKIVKTIQDMKNIHQHLDLIAGLPYEDLNSFKKSFDDVYGLKPEQLQLGFLKVLKGSYMEEKKADYGLMYQDQPPYEVLATNWLSYGDVIKLKGVEEMVEVYYNSGQFSGTLEALEGWFSSAYGMYEALAEYYEKQGLNGLQHKRASRYEILLQFVAKTFPNQEEFFRELLTYDYYLRENAKTRPTFAKEVAVDKEVARQFYETEAKEHKYLAGYDGYDKNQIRRMTHLEYFAHTNQLVLFDYQNRNPLNLSAKTYVIAS